MNARTIRSKGRMRWLGPVVSLAVSCALFASCSTEERDFETARNNSGNGQDDGGNAATTDGGGTADGGTVAADACEGKDDGDSCGSMSGFICVNQSCRESSCGDGFRDQGADEECDDGNTDPGDGCEPATCTLSCETDADCDDGDPCNGDESCDTDDNVCQAGNAPDTTEQVPCTLPLPPAVDAGVSPAADGGLMTDASGAPVSSDAAVISVDGSVVPLEGGASVDGGGTVTTDAGEPVDPTVGFCKAGLCVPAGCGNGILQAGEECDDFNIDNADGCKADCTFTCESDEECDDINVCTGTETCDTDDHLCVPGEQLDCDDDNDCTENDCDPLLACLNTLIDEDGDGHASTEIGACGDDCDDDDETTYLGAPELCDGIDNDCDLPAGDPDNIDEAAPFWYLDCDGDDYAQEGAESVQNCNAPSAQAGCVGVGWTTRRPVVGDLSTIDCFDLNASVYPNADPYAPYSTTAVPGKSAPMFDWNCSGANDKQYPDAVAANAYCGPPIIFEPVATTEQSSRPPIAAQVFYLCWGADGYADPPACGVGGTFTWCGSGANGCERFTEYNYEQPCR